MSPASGDHTQLPTAASALPDSVSPDTTPTEAAAVILLERSLSNHHQPPRPRHAHSGNFCVFSSCWFSTSILIPAHGIAHLGIPYYESFCGQHWDCCPPEALLHGEQAQTGNSEQPDGSGGAVSRLSNGPTLLTLPPWTFALPANLRSLPTKLGRVLVVQKIGAQS